MRLLFFCLITSLPLCLHSQIITTVAGNGTWGYSGDGGPATQAQLSSLYNNGVAIDAVGNTYISDFSNNVIRKVNTSGIISTFAGTGILGYSGDGGSATNAMLYHPSSIIIDSQGDLIFADQNASLLRKINQSGVITTIAGNIGSTQCTGDGGQVSNAVFASIMGIAIDKVGNIYVSDGYCNRVRKIDLSGIITTIAGNGVRGGSGDGGPAINAELDGPYQVGIDDQGNIYIPEGGGNRIRKVDPSGIITTIAGNGTSGYSGDNGPALQAQFSGPVSACCDHNGNIYIADLSNLVVRKIDGSGIITTYAGNGTWGYSGDGGPATQAQLTLVENVNIDGFGNLYISDFNGTIRKVNSCAAAIMKQQPANVTLCSSGNASFSASASNYSSLQWQVNTGGGWNDLIDNSTYSGATGTILQITNATTSMNNYEYRCLAKNSCGSLISDKAILKITSPQTPTISITSTVSTICEGAVVSFTATSSNGGTAPTFNWMKNGNSVGTNSPSYTDNGIKNGDIISCTMTSNETCLSTNTTNSNSISVSVNPLLTPSITITPSDNNICSGTTVSFSSSINNGGNAPQYLWQKNGIVVGTNSISYSDNALTEMDVVECILTSNYGCLSTTTASSNKVTMHVLPLIAPRIVITSSSNTICAGNNVGFSATSTNSGTKPIYKWTKNGSEAGTNSPFYSDNSFVSGDAVQCQITSNASCLSSATALSNSIPITVYRPPSCSLDHTNTLCSGDSRTLDAGSFSSYIWNDGSTGRYLTVYDKGIYFVEVTDNHSCKGRDTTIINTMLSQPANFLSKDTSICSYGSLVLKSNRTFSSYLWNTASSTSSITITSPGIYWLEAKNDDNCIGRDSVVVSLKECMKGMYVPTAFTPNGDGRNDVFKPLVFGKIKLYTFTIYNRWGNIVFQSRDTQKGWNGDLNGVQQQSNVFVWTCTYQLENGSTKTERGTVVLIR